MLMLFSPLRGRSFMGAPFVRAGKFVAILVLASGLPGAALAAGASHDGQWRVELQTTVGNCPPGGETVVTLKQNRVIGISASGVSPWGYVDETNTFVGHFSSGAKVLRANGEVKGNSAHGPWSSQTDFCGGVWTAQKID
jgi:ABC-type amino acid transport substrate-binding protein